MVAATIWGKGTQWGQNADRYLRLPERKGKRGKEKGINKALNR